MLRARTSGAAAIECSLDLERSVTTVEIREAEWVCQGGTYPYLERCKDRTVYYWSDCEFRPVARYNSSLIKLIPTEWGAPTFEIDGIKMLPTAADSPFADAERKVGLIQPQGKIVLDTCGGLGYFAAWCVRGRAALVKSYEKNADVIWLRSLNPWSPSPTPALTLTQADITVAVETLPDRSIDAILHDPPRFGIAGELYSQRFYSQLARVLKRRGKLFHYTGSPNRTSRARDLPGEVMGRLRRCGFAAERTGDGILAVRD